jgi:talin
MSAAQGSLPYNTNQVVHQHLLSECRHFNDQVPRLLESVKATSSRPEDPEAQLTLIEISESMLQPGGRVVQSTRGAMPTVSDQASSTALGQCSQQLASSLNDLRSAAARAREACGPGLELESAERLVAGMREELAAFERQAQMAQLKPLPGDNVNLTPILNNFFTHLHFVHFRLMLLPFKWEALRKILSLPWPNWPLLLPRVMKAILEGRHAPLLLL